MAGIVARTEWLWWQGDTGMGWLCWLRSGWGITVVFPTVSHRVAVVRTG